MARAGLGALGLWLHLRGQPQGGGGMPPLPTGTGPVAIVCADPDTAHAARQVVEAMSQARPDLRILDLAGGGLPGPADDPVAAPRLIETARPSVVVLFGACLPPALIEAACRATVPAVLVEARLAPEIRSAWSLSGGLRQRLMGALSLVMVPDAAVRATALRLGVPEGRVRVTGPVAEIHDPLPCVEAERMALAAMLRGRHVWLAAAVPGAEEQAVIAAHRAALRHSHRALLILVPATPGRAATLVDELEEQGLLVACRAGEEDPTGEIQVLVAEETQEMGLWYRLAQVSYLGGTLSGDDAAARQPFEPAALGSAIIHGPAIRAHKVEWRHLDGAGATRPVRDAATLSDAVVDLIQPDQAARLAGNAWTVATGGAGVARRIAQPILDLLPPERPAP